MSNPSISSSISLRILRRAAAPLALMLAVIALAACNTVEGAGRDLSATGRAISTTADRAAR